jgi:hypothetical protein
VAAVVVAVVALTVRLEMVTAQSILVAVGVETQVLLVAQELMTVIRVACG